MYKAIKRLRCIKKGTVYVTAVINVLKQKRACDVEAFFLKPNWYEEEESVSEKRNLRMRSKIFEAIGEMVIPR